jgi:hypothetical protein
MSGFGSGFARRRSKANAVPMAIVRLVLAKLVIKVGTGVKGRTSYSSWNSFGYFQIPLGSPGTRGT